MIQLAMTDGDVIERAAAILGVQPRKPYQSKAGHKPVYGCFCYGSHAIGWMMTLYTFLGERRRARIEQILETWKAKKYTPRPERGAPPVMATCHPNRPRRVGNLCQQCYNADYKQRTGKTTTHYRHLKIAEAV